MVIRNFADVKVNIKTEDILKTNVIYKLTFPSGKSYIGLTNRRLKDRLYEHCNDSFNNKIRGYRNKKARAIRKYMEFSVDILYQGEDLDNEEIKFIKELDTFKNGYNSTLGGEGSTGLVVSDETKEQLSIKSKQTFEDKGYNFMKPKTKILKEINLARKTRSESFE